MSALLVEGAKLMVPAGSSGPLDATVAPNFERFDGLDPLFNAPGTTPLGANYGPGPRPGAHNQPTGQEYTRGPLAGLTNTLGAQPLPVHDWLYDRTPDYTPARWAQTMQVRFGNGQYGPAEIGAAQTARLADITMNPPQPDSLYSIISGGGF